MKNIKCNVKQSVTIVLIGIALLAICFFLGFCDFRQYVEVSFFNNNVVYYLLKAFMVFGFVFFGLGILVVLRNVLFFRDRMIEFEEDYLIDRSSLACGGKIQYAEIAEVYIKGPFLCIALHNAEQYLKRQHFLKRLFMRANKKMGYDYVTVTDNFIDTDVYEIKKNPQRKIKSLNQKFLQAV